MEKPKANDTAQWWSVLRPTRLKRRNSIAHGEDTFVSVSDVDEIADRVIGLMRSFGNAIGNKAVLKHYKA